MLALGVNQVTYLTAEAVEISEGIVHVIVKDAEQGGSQIVVGMQ